MARPRVIDREEVVGVYLSGLSYRKTAKRLNISERACARILVEAGVGRHIKLANRMKFPACDKKWARVAKLYASGMSSGRIATECGYHPAHIRQIVKVMGISRSLKEAAAIRTNRPSLALHNGYRRWRKRYAHRAIVEEVLGRRLSRNEVVHHKNGNRTDNRLCNLEVLTNSEHMRLHRRLKYWSSH